MPRIPKIRTQVDEAQVPTEKIDEIAAWTDEQKKHEYYYDDAHGYEQFDPDSDDDEEED